MIDEWIQPITVLLGRQQDSVHMLRYAERSCQASALHGASPHLHKRLGGSKSQLHRQYAHLNL